MKETRFSYNLSKPWESLDPWQEEVIKAEGNIVVRSGRQSGKSTAISIKAGEFAIKQRNKNILVISSVERQAYLLFEKILEYITAKYSRFIKMGKVRPTKSKIELKNGSIIRCLPTGLTGRGIRGYTVDMLIADEAAFIPEDVWSAVTPMIAVTRGKIVLLSTPFGRSGYFYRCFKDESFDKFHISSEDCPRADKDFLKQEKDRMTKLQYAQEYLGEFIDELRQYFPDELIKKCMKVYRLKGISHHLPHFLGVDVARLGKDESTFQILNRTDEKKFTHVDNIVTTNTHLTSTIDLILTLEKKYMFSKIYIDDGGLGAGVFDTLLQHPLTRRKVVAINNSSRPLTRDERRKKKILKEDLYTNLLNLMEHGDIDLLKDDEIFLSLKSVQYEFDDGKMKIFGNYTHITEGLIRAAWAKTDKRLKLYYYR